MKNYAAWSGAFMGLVEHADLGSEEMNFLRDELIRQSEQGWEEPDWDAARRQWDVYAGEDGGDV